MFVLLRTSVCLKPTIVRLCLLLSRGCFLVGSQDEDVTQQKLVYISQTRRTSTPGVDKTGKKDKNVEQEQDKRYN